MANQSECAACRYSRRIDDHDTGAQRWLWGRNAPRLECRRLPPQMLAVGGGAGSTDSVAVAAFPRVDGGWWCGEWAPAPRR